MNLEKEKSLKALESGEILSREQWKSLIKDPTKEDARIFAEKPAASGTGSTESGSLSGDLLNLPITAAMTAITAVSAEATVMPAATV